ncbi:MAG: hypothetical protein J0M12_13800, partial [Deltaproteobacteria bacterium]|nr:hypothetical protein [Deltaproteobacteria bacterium]
ELLDSGVIDARLFQWSQELQKQRNIAAHASEQKVSSEDAHDVMDFVIAICEYVFVLNKKFGDFMARRGKPITVAA